MLSFGRTTVMSLPENLLRKSARSQMRLGADLIVLPTRGHSGLKRIALGSTAERVVRHARCPVLIPRGKKFKAATGGGKPAGKF